MPCPSCPLCSGAPKTRHFTSYKHTTDHALLTGAAAGIAAVNSIGNLGGYFGPQAFGLLRDHTGSDVAGLIFLAGCGFIGMLIVLLLGYNPAISRSLAAGAAS
jgi:nitrate/nitrite transporter NarK